MFIAWRHIHGIFAAAGAINVIWSWDHSHQYRYRATMASRWYPGNAYVDWVGIDGCLGGGQTVAQVKPRASLPSARPARRPTYAHAPGGATARRVMDGHPRPLTAATAQHVRLPAVWAPPTPSTTMSSRVRGGAGARPHRDGLRGAAMA
jgi:hypothetical protein